jgi:VIT1/CCC1 family predicted Fe2+/Mn2+ transporter
MPFKRLNEPDNGNQFPGIGLRAQRSRSLAVVTLITFIVSLAFPVVAGFVHDTQTWPKWWGTLDVALAFVLALLAFAVIGVAHGRVTTRAEEVSYRAYRILLHGLLAMLVLFFLFGDRIVWSQCLTGYAWRAWLLLYILPAWFTIVDVSQRKFGPDNET